MSVHDVRLIYQKTGRAKYISHLDMNRLIPRVLRRSGLPVWYSQGFNPRVHVVFALPLSLGFESQYDVVDFRITDDEMSNETVLCQLKKALPEDIVAVDVTCPVLKPKDVKFADFVLNISCDEENGGIICKTLAEPVLQISKKTKKGGIKTFDVKPFIKNCNAVKSSLGLNVSLTLTAGNDDNINPTVIFDAIAALGAAFKIESVVRGNIYDKDLSLFR